MLLTIKAFNIKSQKEFNLIFFIEEDADNDTITIRTKLNNDEISVTEEFYFTALQKIRIKLLQKNLDLKCYGAMENVYPSPMMMNTTKAYFLENGKQAKEKDIVDIFDYSNISKSVSVEKQNLFYKNWIKSL